MAKLEVRKEEKSILKAMLESDRPEFLALYGRRRVGKTHLIRDYFGSSESGLFFDVAGTKDAPMTEQIANFMARLGEVFHGGLKLAPEKNWNDAFRVLTELLSQHKSLQPIILFFDEFPWMATKNSRLLQRLDYYWNQYWSKDKRIKLIICGSSASWIIDKIVNNTKGLHNRITRHIHLEPFNLIQMKNFLHNRGVNLSHSQLLKIYMVTGGVPYYLVNIERGKSAAQIIDTLAFKQKAPLLNEFDNLFSSLFEDHQICADIIKMIASHHYGLGKAEILEHLGKRFKGEKGIKLLKSLEECGFIMSFVPHLHSKKGTYYRVVDEYCLFYLSWIEPIKKTLLRQSFEEEYWQIQERTAQWKNWSGYAFESVCYKHIRQIKKALKLQPVDIPNAWRYVPAVKSPERGAQIDLLFDRQDDCISLGEIKYTEKAFIIDKAYALDLQRKMAVYKEQTRTKKQLFFFLISASGLKESLYSQEIHHVVTLDDLFVEI